MYTRIAAALIAAFLLAAGGWKAYRMGESSVQIQWDKQIAELTTAALAESEANRAKDQALQTKVRKVTNDYIAEKKRNADTAAVLAGRLSELQSTIDSFASIDPATTSGTDGDPRLNIIAECARTANQLDGAVKEMASKTISLQEYAASVCVAK